MAAPVLKPPAPAQAQDRPPGRSPADRANETPRLRRRPTAPRIARPGDDAHPSAARRLQHRLASALTASADGRLETLLMKLVIVAATCLVLRTAIFDAAATGLVR